MNVVILDGFMANYENMQLQIPGHEQVWYPSTAPDQVAARIGDAEAVLVTRCQITRDVIDACPNLVFIGTLGTGYNMIDLQAAAERHIVVSNVPGYSTAAVCQHTLALLLELANGIGAFDQMVRSGNWKKDNEEAIMQVPTQELAGKVLGIFGAGEIGMAVARVAAALGMEVLAFRRTPPANSPDAAVQYVDVDTLLTRADVLSIHAPLTDETDRFFDAATLAKMKDGALLLNTARGAIVDERAVAAALNIGKLAGYGADVMISEPPEADNPLVGHPRAVLTPHVAWTPKEARTRLLDIVSRNILAFAAGRPINTVAS